MSPAVVRRAIVLRTGAARLCDTLVVPEVNQFNRGQFAHVSHVDFIGTHKKVPAGTTHGRAAVNSRF